MKASASSNSSSTKWSEQIIVVGKGFPNWSSTYGCLTQCAAGIDSKHRWMRLYPIFVKSIFKNITAFDNFDVIQTILREEQPEPKPRAESQKIYPELVRKIRSLNAQERVRLLRSETQKGIFLHDDSWKGQKTLGLIKPEIQKLYIGKYNFPMAKYRCDYSRCGGHTSQLLELVKTDDMGRTYLQKTVPRGEVFAGLKKLSNGELRFVMGTHSQHRHKWMVVAAHLLGGK